MLSAHRLSTLSIVPHLSKAPVSVCLPSEAFVGCKSLPIDRVELVSAAARVLRAREKGSAALAPGREADGRRSDKTHIVNPSTYRERVYWKGLLDLLAAITENSITPVNDARSEGGHTRRGGMRRGGEE